MFKDFPLRAHPLARPAHEAARCAGSFAKYWPYHDRLFAAQPRFEREHLIEYATALGIPRDPFVQCLDSGRFADAVDNDVAQGRALGVTGTPTFIINGAGLVGAHPVEAFRELIDRALRSRQ